jgi:hypothetical protein
MIELIRKFAQWNRRLCRMLDLAFPSFFVGRRNYSSDLLAIVNSEIRSGDVEHVLEAGGIDRPLLSRGDRFKYIGLDIEGKPSCYEVYDEFLVQSIELEIPLQVDLVISTTLLEHVFDNTQSAMRIYNSLRSGGKTVHYVPSKFHPYSIILRAVGHRAQKFLISALRPDALQLTGYPAFFDHCSPKQMHQNFSRVGFVDVDVKPYYRATDYFAFFLPAYVIVAIWENIIERIGATELCSGFIIIGRKPETQCDFPQ